MAISINHDMDQGANFSFTHTVKGNDNIPIDISNGYTAYAQMRRFYSSTNAVSLNASITGSTGQVLVSLGATATSGVKAGVWFYDLELHSNGSNTVQRLVQGMITVYPEVTKIP
jgi:hypothetical protein